MLRTICIEGSRNGHGAQYECLVTYVKEQTRKFLLCCVNISMASIEAGSCWSFFYLFDTDLD